MKLIDKMLTTGNYLFQYRGQIPIVLFLVSAPIIYQTSFYNTLEPSIAYIIQYTSIFVGCLGLILRYITVGTSKKGTSGRNRNCQIAEHLNTKGIYSIVRNPLYLGNLMIWIGASMYSLSYVLLIIISFFFILKYERIILTEEAFLLEKYGKEYTAFAKKTSVFIPKFDNYIASNTKFSFKKILKQEYSSTLSTIISYLFTKKDDTWREQSEGHAPQQCEF